MGIRLVVGDPHSLLRLGVAGVVAASSDIEMVGEAGTGAATLELVERVSPDVVTLDAAFPDADGFGLARRLRQIRSSIGLVMLTSTADHEVLHRATKERFSAYVTKAAPAGILLAAIRHASVEPELFRAPGLPTAVERRALSGGPLSHRERQVLALMRDGMSVPGIAAELSVSEATIKTYVSRLYSKLQVNNRSQALMAAVNQGLLRYADAA